MTYPEQWPTFTEIRNSGSFLFLFHVTIMLRVELRISTNYMYM